MEDSVKNSLNNNLESLNKILDDLDCNISTKYYRYQLTNIENKFNRLSNSNNKWLILEDMKNLHIDSNLLIEKLEIIQNKFYEINSLWNEVENSIDPIWRTNLLWTMLIQYRDSGKRYLQFDLIEQFDQNIVQIRNNWDNLLKYIDYIKSKDLDLLNKLYQKINENLDLFNNYLKIDYIKNIDNYRQMVKENIDNINNPDHPQRGNIRIIDKYINMCTNKAEKTKFKVDMLKKIFLYLHKSIEEELIRNQLLNGTFDDFYYKKIRLI